MVRTLAADGVSGPDQRRRRLIEFQRSFALSEAELAKLINVTKRTVRRYLAEPNLKSHRAVDPTIGVLLDYLAARPHLMTSGWAEWTGRLSAKQFDALCGDRQSASIARLMRVNKGTVSRWRSGADDYDPAASASKLILFFDAYGWPET